MNKQRVHLTSCQCIIDSVILYKKLHQTKFYLLWTKGKKFSRSNLYDIELNEEIIIKQKLQMSLKIYQRNNKIQIKNTNLDMIVCYSQIDDQQSQPRSSQSIKQIRDHLEEERILCSFTLAVHEWNQNLQKLQLQIVDEGKIIGSIAMQVRRKFVMDLDNFDKYTGEIEESSEEEENVVMANMTNRTKNTEFIELKNQLEDLNFLNDKLKKDRAFLIARNDQLQAQNKLIKQTVESQLQKVQIYFTKKLSIHASIYQQQIQEIITRFNQNSNTNLIIMKSIISENEGLSAELTQLRIISEQQMQKQQAHYQEKLTQAFNQRKKLEEYIQQLENKNQIFENLLNQSNRKLELTKEELDNLTLTYGIETKQNKQKCLDYDRKFEGFRKNIADLTDQLEEKTQLLQQSRSKINQLETNVENKQISFQKQLHEKAKLMAEIQAMKQLIQAMKADKKADMQILKKIQDDYKVYIEQSEKKNIEYQKQIQQIQYQSKNRELQFDKAFNQERQKYYSENIKNSELHITIENMQKLIIVKDEQIKSYIDQNAKLNEQFLQQHRRIYQYSQQNKQLSEQLQHHKQLLQTSQLKVNYLNEQLQSTYKKNQSDLQGLKQHFEQSVKNREKYYEEELQIMKIKLQGSQGMYMKLTNQFKNQIEFYKKQIDKVQQQSIKIMTENGELLSNNKKLQFQNAQFLVLLHDAKQIMREKQRRYDESIRMLLDHSKGVEEIKRNILAQNQKNAVMVSEQSSALGFSFPFLQDSNTPKNNPLEAVVKDAGQQKLENPLSLFAVQNLVLKTLDYSVQQMPEEFKKKYSQVTTFVEDLSNIQNLQLINDAEQKYRKTIAQLQSITKQLTDVEWKLKSANEEIKFKDSEMTNLKNNYEDSLKIIQQLQEELRQMMVQSQYRERPADEEMKKVENASMKVQKIVPEQINASFGVLPEKMPDKKSTRKPEKLPQRKSDQKIPQKTKQQTNNNKIQRKPSLNDSNASKQSRQQRQQRQQKLLRKVSQTQPKQYRQFGVQVQLLKPSPQPRPQPQQDPQSQPQPLQKLHNRSRSQHQQNQPQKFDIPQQFQPRQDYKQKYKSMHSDMMPQAPLPNFPKQIRTQEQQSDIFVDEGIVRHSTNKNSHSLEISQTVNLEKLLKEAKIKLGRMERENSELNEQIERMELSHREDLRKRIEKIQRLQVRNKELFEQNCSLKQDKGMKFSLNQSKLLEYSELTKRQQEDISKMKNTILQKQHQMRQNQHSFQLQKNRYIAQNQQLKSQIKKLKNQIEDLEAKSKRTQGNGYDYTKVLQQQLEETNRKISDLVKQNNHMKMEKQSAEDQIRILKKKYTDMEKNIGHINEKKSHADQELEVTLRKFNKNRRELQEKQQQLSRIKEQYKRMQDQVTNYTAMSSQTLMQRKKYLQEKLQFQEQINKKQAQNRKLHKQIQKYQDKLQQNNEVSSSRKNQKTKELERLEFELIRYKKSSKQFQEHLEYLTKKYQDAQQRQKRQIQQIRVQYRQKLGTYVEQINQISNILANSNQQLQRNESQNTNLKLQLDRSIGFCKQIEQMLNKQKQQRLRVEQQSEKLIEQLDQVSKQLQHYQNDCIDLHNQVAGLQQQLQRERMLSLRKSEKVEEFSMLSEKYLYELKNLKVALAAYEKKSSNEDGQAKMIGELSRQNTKLKQSLISLTKQYEKYKSTFLYTKSQLDQIITQIHEQQTQARKRQLAQTLDSLDQEYQTKNIKRQKQLMELFNQNAQMRVQLQKKDDENAEIVHKFIEIEGFPNKYRKLKDEYDGLLEENKYLRQEEGQNKTKFLRFQTQVKESQRQISDLKHQIQLLTTNLKNQHTKSSRLEQQLLQSQTGYNILKQQLKKLSLNQNQKTDGLKNTIQGYEQKILSMELQNMRVKERQQNMHREYKQQIRKMQSKIKQLTAAMYKQLEQKDTENRSRLNQKDRLLKQANKQMEIVEQNLKQISQLTETLRDENDQLAAQLSNTRSQMSEDEQIYIMEINKLKNQIKQMQDMYDESIRDLQEEITELNRELTKERVNNRTGLSNSRLRDSEVERRLEDKLKNKDSKIEELKNNVFMLEQSIVNLKKKYQLQNSGVEGENSNGKNKYYALYTNLMAEYGKLDKNSKIECENLQENLRQFKRQLQKSKESQQIKKLQCEKQKLEMQSLAYELKTTKQIYDKLQKQVDRRQIKLTQVINLQAIKQIQYEQANKVIQQLREENQRINKELALSLTKLKQKQNQSYHYKQRLQAELNNINKAKGLKTQTKKANQLKDAQSQSLRLQIQSLQKQNKKLIFQLTSLTQQLHSLRSKQHQSQSTAHHHKLQLQSLQSQLQSASQLASKYQTLASKSLQTYSTTPQQLILGGYIEQKLFDCQQQLNTLRQQVQQLQFNLDRRQMDYQQLRGRYMELEIRVEDYQFVNEQVEGLRAICDRLEEEKKKAVFREEAIRVRLGNLLRRDGKSDDIKDGLQAILCYSRDG